MLRVSVWVNLLAYVCDKDIGESDVGKIKQNRDAGCFINAIQKITY